MDVVDSRLVLVLLGREVWASSAKLSEARPLAARKGLVLSIAAKLKCIIIAIIELLALRFEGNERTNTP